MAARTAQLTTGETEEIERANASGRPPVVFVHGLWLLASSWDPWRELFEAHGYTTLAPSWPGDPSTVEEGRARPELFAGKSVGAVTDHYATAIEQLDRKPVVVGHLFGRLIDPPQAIGDAQRRPVPLRIRQRRRRERGQTPLRHPPSPRIWDPPLPSRIREP